MPQKAVCARGRRRPRASSDCGARPGDASGRLPGPSRRLHCARYNSPMPLTIVAPARLPEAVLEPAGAPLSLPHFETLLCDATIAPAAPLTRLLCDALGVVAGGDPPIAP